MDVVDFSYGASVDGLEEYPDVLRLLRGPFSVCTVQIGLLVRDAVGFLISRLLPR